MTMAVEEGVVGEEGGGEEVVDVEEGVANTLVIFSNFSI